MPLDPKCPNVDRHKKGTSLSHHPISKEKLCSLLRDQLSQSLDENCDCLDRLGLYGNVGVLFKITLAEYGYTFVAKGVQLADEQDLFSEGRIYTHLSGLQGKMVPVHLGTIDLVRPYPLVSCATITQIMLMSWAGDNLRSKNQWPEGIDIEAERKKALQDWKNLMSSIKISDGRI